MIEPGYMAAILVQHWQAVALAVSVLLTLVHAAEEILGEGGPLWEYLGRASGTRIDLCLGVVLVVLATPAWCVGLAAMAYGWPSCGWAMALAGARLGDSLVTHWLPALSGWRPNPGLPTTLLYAAEAALLLALAPVAPLGLMLGAVPFLLLWPALALLRRLQAP